MTAIGSTDYIVNMFRQNVFTSGRRHLLRSRCLSYFAAGSQVRLSNESTPFGKFETQDASESRQDALCGLRKAWRVKLPHPIKKAAVRAVEGFSEGGGFDSTVRSYRSPFVGAHTVAQ